MFLLELLAWHDGLVAAAAEAVEAALAGLVTAEAAQGGEDAVIRCTNMREELVSN